MTKLHHVSCAILSGGEARRAGGRNKSFRLVEGRPVIEHQLERLTALFDEPITVVTDRPTEYADYAVRCIPDLKLPDGPSDHSPMRGLLSAMRDCPDPWVLAVACDSPWPEPDTLLALYAKNSVLLAATGKIPNGLCLKDAHGVQPLPGFYRTDLADALQTLIVSDKRGLRKWIDSTPGIAALCAKDLERSEASIERAVSGFNSWNPEAES